MTGKNAKLISELDFIMKLAKWKDGRGKVTSNVKNDKSKDK